MPCRRSAACSKGFGIPLLRTYPLRFGPSTRARGPSTTTWPHLLLTPHTKTLRPSTVRAQLRCTCQSNPRRARGTLRQPHGLMLPPHQMEAASGAEACGGGNFPLAGVLSARVRVMVAPTLSGPLSLASLTFLLRPFPPTFTGQSMVSAIYM